MTPVLTATGLTRRFGSRTAVAQVSLELAAGELVAVVGPNGAGKTTLLSLLAGTLAPDAGAVTLDGGGGVGWVPQIPAVYGRLSAAENLRLFARLQRVDDVEGTVTRMLEQTALRDRRDEPVARLSGGNRQRVNIAVGLLAGPAVLLLDEPGAALDPRQRVRLWEFVTELAGAGTAIVFSSHDVTEVQRVADRVLVIAGGELLFAGSPGELAATAEAGAGMEAALEAFLVARGH